MSDPRLSEENLRVLFNFWNSKGKPKTFLEFVAEITKLPVRKCAGPVTEFCVPMVVKQYFR